MLSSSDDTIGRFPKQLIVIHEWSDVQLVNWSLLVKITRGVSYSFMNWDKMCDPSKKWKSELILHIGCPSSHITIAGKQHYKILGAMI